MPTPTAAQTAPPQLETETLVPKSQAEQVQMSFPAAMQKVKDGLKVRRAVNPEGYYVYIGKKEELTGPNKGDQPAYLCQHWPNGHVDAVLFAQVDVDADDWEVLVAK